MRCNQCKSEMPYMPEMGKTYDCLFCGEGLQRPTAEEYLSKPELQIVTEHRQNQIDLTKLIDTALTDQKIVVAEAGTGVGKSFAYLIPVITSGKRAVISTAKKSLQSQLLEKDLPFLRKTLGINFTFAPAYGKSNYACKHAVNRTVAKRDYPGWEGFFHHSKSGRWEELDASYKKWLTLEGATTHRGAPPRKSLRLSAENCIGSTCKYYKECGYIAERTEMLNADVVVANHWLVGYHFKIAKENNYELLGPVNTLIVDEAHKFEEGIRDAFTDQVSENELINIFGDYETGISILLNGWKTVPPELEEIPHRSTLLAHWKALFDKVKHQIGKLESLDPEATPIITTVGKILKELTSTSFLETVIEAPKNSPNPASLLASVIKAKGGTALPDLFSKTLALLSDRQQLGWKYLHKCISRLTEIQEILISGTLQNVQGADIQNVVYVENLGRECYIRISPIDVSQQIKEQHENTLKTAVYVSATLAINNSMDIFKDRVGLSSLKDNTRVMAASYGSAFDLNKQAILYIAKDMPEPSREGSTIRQYREALKMQILELMTANAGNAFVLFTARDEMEATYSEISSSVCMPIFMQTAKTSAAETLRNFKTTPNSTLFGLKSFWEGVDISGDKLSLVVITKLPFPGRSDPVIEAKRAAAGSSAFHTIDLPDMTLDLRQGVGRLIRSTTDRGVIAILDSRLITKPYRNKVLNSLGISKPTTNKQATLRALENLKCSRQTK